MIKKQSDDPNIEKAAEHALLIVKDVIDSQPKANQYDYGGHELNLGDYAVCTTCTRPIAEAQQIATSLLKKAEEIHNETIKEHIILAAKLFETEAQVAIIRAEFHNGHNTEPILNILLGYQHDRSIHDSYEHSHYGSSK